MNHQPSSCEKDDSAIPPAARKEGSAAGANEAKKEVKLRE